MSRLDPMHVGGLDYTCTARSRHGMRLCLGYFLSMVPASKGTPAVRMTSPGRSASASS